MAAAAIDLNALLADVKDALDITWDSSDSQVLEFIKNGMFYINDKAGKTCDYAAMGYPRTLLFEYVRYARSRALEVFENNFQSLLLSMQTGEAVSAYVSDTNTDEE